MLIYQIFTRLFGNETNANVVNGTLQQNGCAKFENFTPKALNAIRELGATHVWFTGVIEHATQTDYSHVGAAADPCGVVKGRAGSPYAIRDYYDIDPDLATNPENRMQEFEALVERTHKAGLKVIIDFVPNHVARCYHSDQKPETDFGLGDRTDWHFSPQNNFYYCPQTPFSPQFDAKGYTEFPARATGNDCFSASPSVNDWYETVKLNYGVDYTGGGQKQFSPMPDTWLKMRDILLFWAAKGIDGFRCDMAEMVPVEFWHWVIAEVKHAFPQLIFVAEVYNPAQYRSYIFDGGFDYLYDKVGLYDTLRAVVRHEQSTHAITHAWQSVDDIQSHMLNFVENHDEQRLASDFFAANADCGRPAMLVAAAMNTNPAMIYFGQELGERGMEAEGFSGCDGRTTIFDYWSVASVNRWFNGGKCNLAKLDTKTRSLRQFYQRLLTACNTQKALSEGAFFDLMYVNPDMHEQYAFLRSFGGETLVCLANFADCQQQISLNIPQHAFDFLHIAPHAQIVAFDLLSETSETVDFAPDKPLSTTLAARSAKMLKITQL